MASLNIDSTLNHVLQACPLPLLGFTITYSLLGRLLAPNKHWITTHILYEKLKQTLHFMLKLLVPCITRFMIVEAQHDLQYVTGFSMLEYM